MAQPAGQLVVALSRGLIDSALRPLAKRRLDEAPGLALGLRPLDRVELVADAQGLAGVGEVVGAKG